MPTKLRGAVEANFPHVADAGEYLREERQLAGSLMCNLRVKAEGRPDPGSTIREGRCTAPRGRRRGDRENVEALVDAVAYGGARVRVEIEMCVKVDHLTP